MYEKLVFTSLRCPAYRYSTVFMLLLFMLSVVPGARGYWLEVLLTGGERIQLIFLQKAPHPGRDAHRAQI